MPLGMTEDRRPAGGAGRGRKGAATLGPPIENVDLIQETETLEQRTEHRNGGWCRRGISTGAGRAPWDEGTVVGASDCQGELSMVGEAISRGFRMRGSALAPNAGGIFRASDSQQAAVQPPIGVPQPRHICDGGYIHWLVPATLARDLIKSGQNGTHLL